MLENVKKFFAKLVTQEKNHGCGHGEHHHHKELKKDSDCCEISEPIKKEDSCCCGVGGCGSEKQKME